VTWDGSKGGNEDETWGFCFEKIIGKDGATCG